VNSTIILVLGGIISGALFISLLELVKYMAHPCNQLPTIVYLFRTGTPIGFF
jgi:iron complex transport system permease protein